MKRILFFIIILVLFSSCGRRAKIDETNNASGSGESFVTEYGDDILQDKELAELPQIDNPGLEHYIETNNVDKMLQYIDIVEYDSELNNRDMLENLSWYRNYSNRDNIITAAKKIEPEISVEGVYSSFFPAVNNNIPLQDVLTECALEKLYMQPIVQ